MADPLADVVARYADYGPLLAAFLANLLATFGDKGQLVVIALASRYDPRRVVAGAMAAFALWTALEVVLGSYATALLPAGVVTAITGTLFLAFGVLTLRNALAKLRVVQLPWPLGLRSRDGGDRERMVPAFAARYTHRYGAVVTSFIFVLFAEFGDKTQLLTIALAGTFPESPLAVFVGAIAALGLRTTVDALIGDRLERHVPTARVMLAAGVVFLAFGLALFGVISEGVLVAAIAVTLLGVLASLLGRR